MEFIIGAILISILISVFIFGFSNLTTSGDTHIKAIEAAFESKYANEKAGEIQIRSVIIKNLCSANQEMICEILSTIRGYDKISSKFKEIDENWSFEFTPPSEEVIKNTKAFLQYCSDKEYITIINIGPSVYPGSIAIHLKHLAEERYLEVFKDGYMLVRKLNTNIQNGHWVMLEDIVAYF